ncbi:hypothetical protein K1719_015818 [Acacia pycnantha]|nr:hypothetical protein K1719_015818 [Acacia pycnantha]
MGLGSERSCRGSCNGLICICNVAEDIALWNLSTRQHKIIALLPVERRPESDSSLFAARGYGFGRFSKPPKLETVIDLDDDFEADFVEFKDDSDIDVDEDDVDVKPFASYAIKPSKKPSLAVVRVLHQKSENGIVLSVSAWEAKAG